MTDAVDIDHLKTWIGREETAEDRLDARLVASFLATLDQNPGTPSTGEEAPLCIHWCLSPAIVPNGATGPDGHPSRGGFLPPVPLPRRMWAGGELCFGKSLRVGDKVTRRSTIENVALKEGRTGTLCFVTVRHRIEVDGETAISERQDIVYREAEAALAPSLARASQTAADAREPALTRSFEPSPLALFRYSALTFNGHRIHYDRRYARDEEHYPGLVVHGPLQATLLAHLAAEMMGTVPSVFSYRGVRPLFDDDGLVLNGAKGSNDGTLELWSAGRDGAARMTATAS